ncbi:MAG: tRNA uridine-5-carboxymethylaminomethyl(34) synthesis enzyme MnmG [Clostridiaceae bacterium]|jgi:tRNA uridine 5-carboxymethylaminomethyl modification enzyme|nr:tRNA uridine-5-carboxymethylaminomethyl(34) synthesis enzyme MnmG [Clostridiaceae bacterium]
MTNIEQALNRPNAWLADEVDIIVVGAGHAGCEAALATARLGCRTILFGMNLDVLANLPCNPNIGGTAKGQLVREIDALGGEMGKLADRTMIQFRMLNTSRGPAVLSPRAQIDRRRYQEAMKHVVENQPRLLLRQGEIVDILVESEDGKLRVVGVQTKTGAVYLGRAVIAATGTYMEGRIIIGERQYDGGPDNLFPSIGLAESLRRLGLPLQRFKTGTPVRVNAHSIDFDQLERQDGDKRIVPFSFSNEDGVDLKSDEQRPCYVTWTSLETGRIIRENLHRSPLYSGVIEGIGPRYCPSVEDKFVKFPDKERHQVFFEPMGWDTEELYLQGMSTSMPEDVQVRMVRSLPGCEHAVIQRSAYAIEYDCLDPTCLKPSLETRAVSGLFGAGQINGSSGYEEAAAQGLIAGINAVRLLRGQEAVIIDRSQGYIGVLIDDLVTKGTREPYRMMTSLAEYRLLLRQDNADARLTPIGREVGLIDDERWAVFVARQSRIKAEIDRFHKTRVKPGKQVNDLLMQKGSSPLKRGCSLAELIKRPELNYAVLAPLDPARPALCESEQFAVEVELKYEGYIRLEAERMAGFRKMEKKMLPPDLDYMAIRGLRIEAQQKLQHIQPISVGQASRISGVSPADISVLLIYLQTLDKKTIGGGERNDG